MTVMDVKGSTKQAKQASYMTLVYHNLIYMIMNKIVTTQDSMISKSFAGKLALAKSDEQLEKLVLELAEKHFPKHIQSDWNIPKLEDMEIEAIHLATFWNDHRVSVILYGY